MWSKSILLISLVLIVSLAALVLYGKSRWEADSDKLRARLQAALVQSSVKTYAPREIADLPAPVQRYFRTVLRQGRPLTAAVNVAHNGTFNMSKTGEDWKAFRSTQRVVTRRPGFVWDACIRMAPGMDVYVRDAYVAGEGVLTAELLGILPVMKQPPTPELAHGELMRFLAEAAWYPTALLPSQGVLWEPIDDTQASATLTDGPTTVTLVFQFDAEGLISSVRSDGRYREVDGTQMATPWQGRFWDYEVRHGMLIPLEGEVAWVLQDGPETYWRGRIQRIEYEHAH